MKPAIIFSLPMATSHGYCWRWRSVDGKTDSTKHFAYYYDCLADANASGHSVEVVEAHGNTAPGWRSLPTRAVL